MKQSKVSDVYILIERILKEMNYLGKEYEKPADKKTKERLRTRWLNLNKTLMDAFEAILGGNNG